MKDILANRYRYMKKLGEGGMADVYLAFDTILSREVAIKVLRGNLSLDPVALLRFQREANAASALDHPNIVQIYDVGEEDSQHYIVMEYVRGRTLKELIMQRGAMDKKEAVAIMEQLLLAVIEAHKKNIIHRDIKPQNIMIKDDGTVKMADFGIAIVQDALQLTQTDTVLGSVHYLAPEISRGEPASFQSDIYSLGITFYELLTGQVPHQGEAPVQVAMKHMRDEMPSVIAYNPSIPQSIENIVIKATAKHKQNRYKMASDMLDDIHHCFDDKLKTVPKLMFKRDKNDDTIMIEQFSTMPNKPVEKNNIFSIIAGLGLMVLSGIAIYGFLQLSGYFNPANQTVKIPDLTNLTVAQAETQLNNLGLSLSSSIKYEITDNIDSGLILKSTPSANTEVDKGSVISVTVSKGKYYVVGNYVGMNISEVEVLLQTTKISIRKEYDATSTKAVGTILKQELLLEGDKLDPSIAKEIKLTIADNVQFIIPQVVNQNIDAAKLQLETLGAVVTLNVLPTDTLTPEQLALITYNVVVQINPNVGAYYIQYETSSIVLSYYKLP
ncbi:MAG: Stk1 family PASTA domain-containing Ser/Thr kinase [Erysipelotrichaceae bacterium]